MLEFRNEQENKQYSMIQFETNEFEMNLTSAKILI